ncbi:MAG: hypothetical protein AAF236_08295 [Verrucomicrobiota bacterium]
MNPQSPLILFPILFFSLSNSAVAQDPAIFDMEAIRDPATLKIGVLQDWRVVEGPVATRQKLITIQVGEIWEGQEYRVPVRLVVPVDRKASGFHLTGGHSPRNLEHDTRLQRVDLDLLAAGVGLVNTVVQEPGTYGEGELARASEERFAKSLDPRHKIQYWAWPATLMRAITAAHAEGDHFERGGRIAVTGSSKNGASPSMAIIHDERMTALHASVSPIWDSPLRLCDTDAWDQHRAAGGKQRGFSGGHYGPNFNQRALDAGHSWEELQEFARDISDQVFISRNLESLRAREVEMLFHPGTHDFVAYDLAWGGAHHPTIPVYLGANSGHGKKGHPMIERDQQNKTALLLRHFFPDEVTEPLLDPPAVETEIEGAVLKVTVTFPPDAGDESGRAWWIFDRGDDGSPRYLQELILDKNTSVMNRDPESGSWIAEIPLEPGAARIDFFSNHRKTLSFRDRKIPTYLSSPYNRVNL